MQQNEKTTKRIYKMIFAQVYPLYIAKAERKGRSKDEVNQIIYWLTGYNKNDLAKQLKMLKDFETFFSEAPKLNPNRKLIKGAICGVKVEEIEDPIVQNVRYLDKLIDELSNGKTMDQILRSPNTSN